jgi:hypothetical protein
MTQRTGFATLLVIVLVFFAVCSLAGCKPVGGARPESTPLPVCEGHRGTRQVVTENGNRAFFSTYFLCNDGTVYQK